MFLLPYVSFIKKLSSTTADNSSVEPKNTPSLKSMFTLDSTGNIIAVDGKALDEKVVKNTYLYTYPLQIQYQNY